MELPLYILAGLGILAVSRRLVVAFVHVLRSGVEAYLAGEVAQTRANRGDITGMEEAYDTVAAARRVRGRALRAVVAWAVLLLLPVLLLEAPAPAYAACIVVWFLPRIHGPGSPDSIRSRP